MKNLLLIAIAFLALQNSSCTCAKSLTSVDYPTNAQLGHGNYGGAIYHTQTARSLAIRESYFAACDTLQINFAMRHYPVAPIAAVEQVPLAAVVTNETPLLLMQ